MRRRRTLLGALLTCLLAGAGLTSLASGAVAASGDYGYEDGSFSGVTNPPTSDKPQSKLWYNDGAWWAVMYTPASADWHIYRLDRRSETWADTGVRVDDRKQTLSDVLWDGTKLYVASNWVTVSTDAAPKAAVAKPSRLYRYSYSPSSGTYSLDRGFPATIGPTSSESITIDEDTTGRLWATWTTVSAVGSGYTNQVYVSSSADGSSWATPTVLPVNDGSTTVAPDDISAVVSYGRAGNPFIGVMYSNQLDGTVYWATHRDGDALGSWKGSVAVRGKKLADDHLNLKTVLSDQQGRVYAAVKTSQDEISGVSKSAAQINLLVYKPGTGAWTVSKFGTISDCHTRPIVMLDEENSQVHVFATAPSGSGCSYTGQPGTIYEKVASMSDLVFPSGRGTPVIRDASSANLNNVTSTKQTVDSRTGLVVLAGNSATSRYWHADLPIGSAPMPTATFTASATTGTSPLTVGFTDTSSGSPTSWSWSFGDGSTSADQNPTHTYTTPGSYDVRLTVTNAAGSNTSTTQTITVVTPPAPTAAFTTSAATGTAPLTVQFTDTSTGSPTSWRWDFGDGSGDAPSTSTDENPSHTYTTPGDYTVTLTATNDSGSTSSSRTVSVAPAPAPTAGFTATPTSGTVPLTVQFTDTSTGSPTSWAWDFGTGDTSTAQNPSYTFTSAGKYQVTLVASNASGSGDPVKQTITVTPQATGTEPAQASVSTTELTTAAAGIDIATPAGTAAGDVLVSCITTNGNKVTSSGVPAGWTPIAAVTGVSNPHVFGYYKVAGGSEPLGYHWTFNTSMVASGGIARFTGVSGLDGPASTASGSGSTATVPGVTTSTANAMLVGCLGINSGSAAVTITKPASMRVAWDLLGKRQQTADELLPFAGDSGSRTWTFSARDWAGWLVALRPTAGQ